MDASLIKLKESCTIYLKNFNNRRKFNSQISHAITLDKSETKKLCLILIKEIFEKENEPYYLFLNDKELSNKLLELIIKGIDEKIEFEPFKSQLFSLSIDLEFMYKISEFYYRYYLKKKDDYWGECLNLFIFQKKFKSENINNLLNTLGIKYNAKTYDDFLIKIKNKYNKSKDFEVELKNIFNESEANKEIIISENKNEKISEKKEQNSEKGNDKNGNFNKSENEITSQNSKLISAQVINEEYEDDTEKNSENNKINETKILKDENNSNIIIDNNIHNLELSIDKNSEINANLESDEIIQKYSDDNKNIDNEGIEMVKINYTVHNYFKDQYNKYKKNYKKIVTPILKNILKDSKIYFSNIGYYNKDNFDDLYKINDKTLSILIFDKLNLDNTMCDRKECGYFCYEYENPENKKIYIIEALYSIIDPVYLFNYCRLNDLYDNYNNPSAYIKNFYVKNRAMALEYYINISVFKEKYNVKLFPRIIFPFKSKNIDLHILNEVELDGVFFVENEFSILDDDLPFIFQKFLSFSGSNKVYDLSSLKYELNGKTFKKNDLCLLEIKTEFPEKFNYNNRDTFPEVLEKMLEKMIIFEQLFTSLDIKYDRIRLILFYDLVSKKDYINDLKKTLAEFAQKHNKLKYLNKICFQVIYVNPSYFVGALRTNAEEIKNLKEVNEKLTKQNNEFKEEIKILEERIKNIEEKLK